MTTAWSRVVFDADLKVEACCFRGILQKFPRHFHEHYVVGLIEGGHRELVCRGRSYTLEPGDLVLFNPRDNHACSPVGDGGLDYRFFNIPPEVMARVARDSSGRGGEPFFVRCMAPGGGIASLLRELHELIAAGAQSSRKKELFFCLLGQLTAGHAETGGDVGSVRPRCAVEKARAYLDGHYAERVSLDELSEVVGLSKYHLLRCFTRQLGISPYSYLEALRVERARCLLRQGISPAETAQRAGFTDQSHFSRFFKQLTGLTPGQYRRVLAGGDQH